MQTLLPTRLVVQHAPEFGLCVAMGKGNLVMGYLTGPSTPKQREGFERADLRTYWVDAEHVHVQVVTADGLLGE